MRRPLVIVALFYACGLLLAEVLHVPILWLFASALSVAALAWTLGSARPVLLWLLILLAGWTNLTTRKSVLSPHDLRVQFPGAAEQVILHGHIRSAPSERISLKNNVETFRTLLVISAVRVSTNDNWHPAFGDVIASVPARLSPEFFSGQEIEIEGVLAPPRRPSAEGLFDYPAYLRRQGIHLELKAFAAADCRLISTNRALPLSDRFLGWAKRTLTRGLPENDRASQLIQAMALGARDVLPEQEYEPFVQSGTMHIFAISGLHIAMIAGILVSLLRVLQMSRGWCGAVAIPLIWFYTGATGWQPSAVRSALMMTFIVGGWSLKRPSDLVNSLAAAALIILIAEPQQLFQASFQLSFFVVLSIALLLPRLKQAGDQLLRHDPLRPPELIPRWQRWMLGSLRAAFSLIATSVSAWLGSWPLTAHYFHLFSPVTLAANVIVVPLSSAALASTLGSLLCGAWAPCLSEWFNHSAWFWMSLMMRASDMAAHLPWAFVYVRSPRFWDFLIYYGVLFFLLSGAVAKVRGRWIGAGALCLAFFYGWRWHAAQQSIELTVLPVNGGSAIYCDAPGFRQDLLVDCGNSNAVVFVTLPFLRAHGVNSLECLALSHGDTRCVGGVPLLQRTLPVKRVATSPVRFRSAAYRAILDSLRVSPERHRLLKQGENVSGWTVLHPGPPSAMGQADDQALVLKAEFSGYRILLLSDLGRAGQERLLLSEVDLRADVVVAGLPQQSEPLAGPLLDRIQPRLIIVVDSELPATRRATLALRERLGLRGIPVWFTRDTGAITLMLNPDRLKVQGMLSESLELKRSNPDHPFSEPPQKNSTN